MKRFISKYYNNKSKNAGFTLIEVLVAVAISSIIILLIYSVHSSIITSIYRLTGVAEFYENVNLAIEKIDRDIACLHFDKKNKKVNFIGESNYDTPYNGKFNFITIDYNDFLVRGTMDSPHPMSDVKEVGYFLEPMDAVPDLFNLMRREEIHYDEEPEEGGDSDILLENVVDLKFEFKSTFSRDWSNSVDSKQTYRIPSAVKTTLIVKDYNKNDQTFVFITLLNRQR